MWAGPVVADHGVKIWWFASGQHPFGLLAAVGHQQSFLASGERAWCPSAEALGSSVTGECFSRRTGELR